LNILLFGPPGAGKGTQSELLRTKLGMKHISTGDLFRNALKNRTPLGLEAKKYLDAGQLVPDDITIGMVEEVFRKLEDRSFILDGFPRNTAQADALEGLLKRNSLQVEKAVFLSVPAGDLVERLSGRRVCEKCGHTYHVKMMPPKVEGICDRCGGKVSQRSDDRREVIEDRIKVYEKNTQPLKDYYEKKGRLVVVDGQGETEDVFARISKVVS
jgi:adenylate kinase